MGQIKVTKCPIEGLYIIEPAVHGDSRGYFMETYSQRDMAEHGLNMVFVQDNQSMSVKGVLRGLHYQKEFPQGKLVRVVKGRVIDVAVDIRKGSPTYMKWVAVELSAENKKMLFIPKGCLHGFVTLTDDVEIAYKVDEFYSPENDRSIRFDDPVFGVEWGCENPVLSEKDKKAPLLKDSDVKFKF